MGRYLGGGLGPDEGLQIVGRSVRDAIDRSEISQQLHLSFFAYARYLGKLRRKIAFLASFAVEFDRGLMRFFTDLQNKAKGERISVKRYRFVLASEYEQVRDLVVTFRRFYQADQLYELQIKVA